MRTLLTRAALVVGLLGLSGAASAADMAVKARPMAPIVPAWSWTGFYLGIHGGYGWGDGGIGGAGSFDIDGGFVGGQLGYNWQMANNWVVGIEVDSAWADIGASGTATAAGVVVTADNTIDYIGSLRGRLGYAGWGNQSLWYVTGGLGWMHNEYSLTVAVPPFVAATSSSNSHLGWTLGGGVEWAFAPTWTLKAEYLYYDFDSETYFSQFGGGFQADAQIHTFKIGLNYLFNR